MPFRHPDRSQGLATRIELEVRERVEEAVDYVCLEALVRARRARGLPPPAADDRADRRAYGANVLAFLQLLRQEIPTGLSPEERRKVASAAAAPTDDEARLVALQVALARLLPDYWQRFEAISARYLAGPDAPSRGEGSGLLARLFGRR
ncbi:MAG TPA: hypothetical protein VFV05_14685 [Methylomirabilota bacterium]|nr:hypothetical protein [Methylomirabilota bacterium]